MKSIFVFSIVATFVFQFSHAGGFSKDVIEGRWGVYEKRLFSSNEFYILKVNNDDSGYFVRSVNGNPVVRHFGPEEFVFRNGYFEINLTPQTKIVFSAWKSERGSGYLGGQWYLYDQNGKLGNVQFFELEHIYPGSNLIENEVIIKDYR